ncbi:MAG: polysaccharide pyruvyl transferase family protein [Acidimicrobiales bacterium]
MLAHVPRAELTVLDFGDGAGTVDRPLGEGVVRYRRQGHRSGRRYYKTDNLTTMAVARRLGITIGAARPIRSAAAVLDVGGGDSFADLYGADRFRLVADLRQLVLGLGTPLVLLPQTYGPFRDPGIRAEAAQIVDDSAMAWARDPDSFAALQELLGSRFDPDRHRLGVDVAFGLPPRRPLDPVAADLEHWRGPGSVGVNISGLVFNDPGAKERYEHRLDYRATVVDLLRRLLDEVERVVLVPHVHAAPGEYESDRAACEAVVALLDDDPRLLIAPDLDADEAKWLISGLDWFCGTRMHATIAALSSGVPCATIAYSLKARGVFATCGMDRAVADARTLDEAEAVEVVLAGFERRAADRDLLVSSAAAVRERAHDQMGEILAAVGVR